jgi:sugar phosphate isomerase/epimerase
MLSGCDATKKREFGFISNIIGKELEGDWKAVLKQVVSFGYSEMETGGYLGNSAGEFLEFLRETGLKLVAGGIDFQGTDEKLQENFAAIKALGMKIAVVYWPWYSGGPFTAEDCKKSAERLNVVGSKCNEEGLVLSWHNHDKEFMKNDAGLPFDYLMANTDPKYVKCELDVYWAAKGGADPVELMKKYSGRFNILHLKDMAPGESSHFECPGSGIIDFPAILNEADSQGITHFMVERDNVQDGIECLRTSAEYLKRL